MRPIRLCRYVNYQPLEKDASDTGLSLRYHSFSVINISLESAEAVTPSDAGGNCLDGPLGTGRGTAGSVHSTTVKGRANDLSYNKKEKQA